MSHGVQVVVQEEFVGAVLSDLSSSRRAHVQGLSECVGRERAVKAHVPLATLLVSESLHCLATSTLPAGLCQGSAQYDQWLCQFHHVVFRIPPNGQTPTERCYGTDTRLLVLCLPSVFETEN